MRALSILKRKAIEKYDRQTKRQRKEFESQLATLKLVFSKRMQSLETRHRIEKREWQEKIREQARQNNENFDREFSRLKRNYQLHLEQVKEIYHRQNTFFASEMKASLHHQMESSKKDYELLAAANQKQVRKFQHWLQDDLIPRLLEKKQQIESSEAERVKLGAELELNKLIEKLDERNSEVEQAKERIKRLEDRAAGRYPRAIWARMRREPQIESSTVQGDIEPRQVEILKIIKEIARERAKIGQTREGVDDEDSVGQLAGSWRSEMTKKYRY
ncbi:MAG: hypothetical protein MN733_01640 [Nitrososphaera sp.]|nr:hypothetical protein [Nitrososphaera sp.]